MPPSSHATHIKEAWQLSFLPPYHDTSQKSVALVLSWMYDVRMEKSKILGLAIDFGTSNSLATAVGEDFVSPPLKLDNATATTNATAGESNPATLKSLIYTPDEGEWYFGQEAMAQYHEQGQEGRMFRSIKKFLPEPNFKGTQVHSRFMDISEIVARFLAHIKKTAEAQFSTSIERVLLGRPVRYSVKDKEDELAEERMRKAAHLAGFKQVSFCPEPLGAAYEYTELNSGKKTVLVADFGGGTSDFSLLAVEGNQIGKESLLGMSGVFCAGNSFDANIMRYDVSHFFGANLKYKIPMGNNIISFPKTIMEKVCAPNLLPLLDDSDIRDFIRRVEAFSLGELDKHHIDNLINLIDYRAGHDIFQKIENVKIMLSDQDSVAMKYHDWEINFDTVIEKPRFEEYSHPTLKRIWETLETCIQKAHLRPQEIDLVFCTGGSCKLPLLRRALEQTFSARKIVWGDNYQAVVKGLGQFAQGEWK
jgi:hypothetical chaperone protein